MARADIEQEFVDGYMDGRNQDCPEPGVNRHPAYRHSFAVGRAELAGEPIQASVSRRRAEMIVKALEA